MKGSKMKKENLIRIAIALLLVGSSSVTFSTISWSKADTRRGH
jgi:hypothetical protein